jgi:hypothetical protein
MSENTRRPRPPGGEERGVFTDALQAGGGYALGKAAVEIVADKLRQAEEPAREEVAALSARVPFSVCGRQGRTPLAATGGVGAAADARRSADRPGRVTSRTVDARVPGQSSAQTEAGAATLSLLTSCKRNRHPRQGQGIRRNTLPPRTAC